MTAEAVGFTLPRARVPLAAIVEAIQSLYAHPDRNVGIGPDLAETVAGVVGWCKGAAARGTAESAVERGGYELSLFDSLCSYAETLERRACGTKRFEP